LITAQVESLTDRLDEMRPLFPKHWEELALNKDEVPLDPQYEIYLNKDAHGEVLFVTLREDGQLIGYFVGFVAPGLHYRTCLTCTMDIFYLDPARRNGNPRPAIKMFRCVEKEARRRGVKRWFVGSKAHKDASVLFEYLGFEKVEVYYSKWLGE